MNFCGPHTTIEQLVMKKASADPRNALNGLHHVVLERFEEAGRRVSLRHFTWEPPRAHRYQDTSHACSLSSV